MDCPFYCAFGQVSSQATDYLPTNVLKNNSNYLQKSDVFLKISDMQKKFFLHTYKLNKCIFNIKN